jgi:FlaG/FlaF family flagellin (archaellin)
MKLSYSGKILTVLMVVSLASCNEDEVSHLSPSIDYSAATPETPYSELFVDTNGSTTVDLTEGNARHKMFQALNYYSTSSVSAKTHIDAAKLKSMFSNSGNPFSDISTSTISVVGAELNSSDVQLKDVVASSKSAGEADDVRAKFESLFDQIDAASNSVNATASKGVAGKLGNYLVDAKGIETAQVIQKSLIGALQLDYIGNILLDKGLSADNHKVVGDNNYTQLEHNWDEAYGLLTLNPIYLAGSTNDVRGTTEFGAGSYIWEYNKANFSKIYPAFLKGRVAIVNNDNAEYQSQALFIRTEFEKAIAAAALGYLEKWKTGADDAARAHAIGEGLGFIYSLRFATIHGGDAAFSDAILTSLIESPDGFWDLTVTKVNTAADAIRAKFEL